MADYAVAVSITFAATYFLYTLYVEKDFASGYKIYLLATSSSPYPGLCSYESLIKTVADDLFGLKCRQQISFMIDNIKE
jgi:hypothetical protein